MSSTTPPPPKQASACRQRPGKRFPIRVPSVDCPVEAPGNRRAGPSYRDDENNVDDSTHTGLQSTESLSSVPSVSGKAHITGSHPVQPHSPFNSPTSNTESNNSPKMPHHHHKSEPVPEAEAKKAALSYSDEPLPFDPAMRIPSHAEIRLRKLLAAQAPADGSEPYETPEATAAIAAAAEAARRATWKPLNFELYGDYQNFKSIDEACKALFQPPYPDPKLESTELVVKIHLMAIAWGTELEKKELANEERLNAIMIELRVLGSQIGPHNVDKIDGKLREWMTKHGFMGIGQAIPDLEGCEEVDLERLAKLAAEELVAFNAAHSDQHDAGVPAGLPTIKVSSPNDLQSGSDATGAATKGSSATRSNNRRRKLKRSKAAKASADAEASATNASGSDVTGMDGDDVDFPAANSVDLTGVDKHVVDLSATNSLAAALATGSSTPASKAKLDKTTDSRVTSSTATDLIGGSSTAVPSTGSPASNVLIEGIPAQGLIEAGSDDEIHPLDL